MYGFDRFAIEVDGKIFSRECGGMFMIQLEMEKPDMNKITPEQFKEEMDAFSSMPGKFVAHASLEEYSKAPGDCRFLVREDAFCILDREGQVRVIDNTMLGREA